MKTLHACARPVQLWYYHYITTDYYIWHNAIYIFFCSISVLKMSLKILHRKDCLFEKECSGNCLSKRPRQAKSQGNMWGRK